MNKLSKPAVAGVALALSLISGLSSYAPKADALSISVFGSPQAPALPQDKLEEMAKHDVIVFIDSSKSMARSVAADAHYCGAMNMPGYALSADGESRWQWCSEQTDILSQQLHGTMKDQLKVVVFSESYKEYKNVDMSSVPTFFNGTKPGGVTNATSALRNQLRGYFAARDKNKGEVRPLLVAIITDGSPDDPMSLKQTIIDATKKMHNADEIAITFLQVGVDQKASQYLQELDNSLVAIGPVTANSNKARFDIVTSKTFAQVDKSGLALALLDAVH